MVYPDSSDGSLLDLQHVSVPIPPSLASLNSYSPRSQRTGKEITDITKLDDAKSRIPEHEGLSAACFLFVSFTFEGCGFNMEWKCRAKLERSCVDVRWNATFTILNSHIRYHDIRTRYASTQYLHLMMIDMGL